MTCAAVRLRHLIQGESWLVIGALASVVFGVLLVIYPGAGLLSVVWLIGIYAVIFGIASLLLRIRLRSLGEVADPALARAR